MYASSALPWAAVFAASFTESLGSLLAATVAFAIGTSVVLRDREREQYVLFAVFCFNLGLYQLARFFFGFSGVALFGWFAQTISLGLPWSADRCFSTFVPAEGHRLGTRVRASLGAALLMVQLLGLVPGLAIHPAWDVVPLVVWLYVVSGLLFAATRMQRAARATAGTAGSSRLRYLFYASVIALALGSPVIPAVGPIVTAVYLYFVAQTLLRERLLDLPEVAGRILSMTVMVVVVTILYSLLLLWVPTRGGGRTLFLFNAAVASFAVIVLIDPVRTEIESRVEGWLFRDRPLLRGMLVQLRQKLVNVIDPEEMVQVVMDELRGSNRVTRASLYLLDRQGMSMVLGGSVGSASSARLDLATRRPLLERMRTDGAIVRDELQRERDRATRDARAELDEILETLDNLGASLALSILGRGRDRDLLGALFVDDERLLEPFSREEIALFQGVASQAATTIQNSAVYEERKERERLAALGEMAAGLAHEIRNPLGAIKGAAQVLEPSSARLDRNTREFLSVIVEEVDRLNRVVVQFLTYSRPFRGDMEPVDLKQVVGATVRLLSADQRERVTIRLDANDLPPVRGDADALRQVFHNLVLNALDATSMGTEPGHVWIEGSVRRRGLSRTASVAVTVRDDGPGLSVHTMTNLFVPFHTTKSGGTGLGLPISQRIVENHRGTIEVANDSDRGARFTVVLPAEAPRAASSSAENRVPPAVDEPSYPPTHEAEDPAPT